MVVFIVIVLLILTAFQLLQVRMEALFLSGKTGHFEYGKVGSIYLVFIRLNALNCQLILSNYYWLFRLALKGGKRLIVQSSDQVNPFTQSQDLGGNSPYLVFPSPNSCRGNKRYLYKLMFIIGVDVYLKISSGLFYHWQCLWALSCVCLATLADRWTYLACSGLPPVHVDLGQ